MRRLGADEAQTAMVAAITLNPADYVDMWAEHNGCQLNPVAVDDLAYDISEYHGCADGADVETVLLEFGGHRWTKYPTGVILDFLFDHKL